MLTVFLDANILFSAAYKPDSRLLILWSLPEITLVTSAYAVEESRRNLPDQSRKATLDRLVKDLRVLLASRADIRLPTSVHLPEKDLPILTAAIQTKADVLLTGDVTHFGHLFGKRIKGVRIMTAADFLATLDSPRFHRSGPSRPRTPPCSPPTHAYHTPTKPLPRPNP